MSSGERRAAHDRTQRIKALARLGGGAFRVPSVAPAAVGRPDPDRAATAPIVGTLTLRLLWH